MVTKLENFKPQARDTNSEAASLALVDEAYNSPGTEPRKPGTTIIEPQFLDFSPDIYGDDDLTQTLYGDLPQSPRHPGDDEPDPAPETQLPDGWSQRGTELHTPTGATVELPQGATNIQIKDGKASYVYNGVTVDLDQSGKPVAYHSNGFSFEYHADVDRWYYHQDSGGDYVQIDVPTVTEDGSVHTYEHGGANSGREHHLTASGQVTEGILDNLEDRLREYGYNADGPFVEGFYPFLGDVNGIKPTIVNAVGSNGGFVGGGADNAAAWDAFLKGVTGRANIIDQPQNLEQMVDGLLASGQPLGNVVIETHGSPGTIYIGDTAYRLDDPAVIEQFSRLNGHMADGARIIFGGCQVGHGDAAQAQLQGIANATGAEVQAFSWVQIAGVPGYGPNIVATPWPTN